MRMTCTLGKLNGDWPSRPSMGKYVTALRILSQVDSTFEDLLFDGHQISTREAGKSGCSFFCKVLPSFGEAIDLLTRIHNRFPKVNIELQVMPDGFYDFGDGGGSYRFAAHDNTYKPQNGLHYMILVDTQNLLRYQ